MKKGTYFPHEISRGFWPLEALRLYEGGSPKESE